MGEAERLSLIVRHRTSIRLVLGTGRSWTTSRRMVFDEDPAR
jgi:hypothetical protein